MNWSTPVLNDQPSGLDTTQQRDWIRLYRSEHVGPVTFRQLINRYGSAEAALEALPELSRRGGLQRAIGLFPQEMADAELTRAQEMGLKLTIPGEPGFPPLLAHADGAPPFLYAQGSCDLGTRRIVSIVGARKASAIGLKIAGDLAAGLAEAGVIVASGLARGIDAAAHKASLNGGTIAVLAGGHGQIYPPEHTDLAAQIAENGLLLSEMPPDYAPRARDFPRRNRIVSGVAAAVVVVEAARRSGSLITARLAGEQGRDLLAVPGSPLDPRADGTNKLIRDGAILARHAGDVLEALGTSGHTLGPLLEPDSETNFGSPIQEDNPKLRAQIIELLSPTPIETDQLARQCNASLADIHLVLLELELAGRLTRHTGARVSATNIDNR